ncbi:MAG: hypothetical protein WA902_02220 [Thermosynechococcaceae cyanobacterium]
MVMDTKMDALHQVIDDLNLKLTTVLLTQGENRSELAPSPQPMIETTRAELSHKDVLIDSQSFDFDRHSGDKPLTPEVQIQRLTAQLTASYNRIAVLEEQLLAQRVH